MLLLHASKFVCDEIPDARFYIAGKFWEKEYRQQLLDERVAIGMVGKFHFIKWVQDMDTLYRSGALLASTSTCESFGLVLLEAMNCGLPVIATDSGGPSEIVLHGETGYIVPVDSVQRLTQKIIYLLKNPHVSDAMGINGYERANDKFPHDKSVGEFTKVLQSCNREATVGHS
jgi:glycosyltransferase involved in cell wall biosynthesis